MGAFNLVSSVFKSVVSVSVTRMLAHNAVWGTLACGFRLF